MKNTMFYAFAAIAERLVSFLLLPILTNIITPEEYAIWSQSIVISGVMIPVVLLGFHNAVVKYFPTWTGQEEIQNSVLLFMLTTVVICLIVVAAVAVYFKRGLATLIFGQPALSFYIPLLIGLLFSEALFELLVGILRATNRIIRVSLYLLMKGVWRLAIVVLVLLGMKEGFYEAFWSFVLFQLVVTCLIYIKEVEITSIVKIGLGIGRNHWKKILQFSLPLVPLAFLTASNYFADRLFLVRSHGLDVVAVYSAGFSFAAIAAFFYGALGFTLFPALAGYWAKQDMESVVSLMNKVVIIYLSLLLPFIVFMTVIGGDFLLLLTNNNYIIQPYILLLLSCNVGLFGLYEIATYIVLLQHGSTYTPLLMGVVVCVNVIFNALLVPEYGMLGAALAGFISNTLLALMFIYLSQKTIHWGFPWEGILRILLRALLMGAVIWFAKYLLGSNGQEVLFLILAVAGAIYGLLDYFDKRFSFFSVIRTL